MPESPRDPVDSGAATYVGSSDQHGGASDPIAVIDSGAGTLGASLSGPRIPTARPDDDGFPVSGWDRYHFIDRLGAGGMGTVYRARDPHLARDVALKFIRGGDPRLTLRLLREARAQARIDHPNVCKVFEAGEIAGKAYIAMELVDGLPLDQFPELTRHQKITIVRDVARALHEAHKLGILHRDIKPGNILLTRPDDDGHQRAVVMDFGIARDAEVGLDLTDTGALLGTPAYMAPEQARNSRDIDRRADVYSLGVTLYELLAGRTPFHAETPVQILLAVLHEDPPPISGLLPDLPADLATIVHQCLHKQPGDRYDSARALAEDLDRHIRGEPILARPEGLARRALRVARRHRALVTISSLALLAIVVASVWGLRQAAEAVVQTRRADERTRKAQELSDLALARARQVREAARVGAARQAFDDPTTAAMILREVEQDDPTGLFGWLALTPHFTRSVHYASAVLLEHSDLTTAAWSPDGALVLTAAFNHAVDLWRPDGTLVTTLGQDTLVRAAAWSPDSARVAVSDAAVVRIWTKEGSPRATLEGHTDTVSAIAWHPGGDLLATGSDDHTARLWRANGELVATLEGHTSAVHQLAWSPDGARLLTSSPWDPEARVWQATGAPIARLTGHAIGVRAGAWSPDGREILTASEDTTARIWRPDGAVVTTFTGHTKVLTAAAWSPDGQHIVTASEDATGGIWQRDGTRVATLDGRSRGLTSAAWHPDGTRVVVAGHERVARVWSIDGRELGTLSGHREVINRVTWSPDGSRILTAAGDRTARVWIRDPHDRVVLTDHALPVLAVAWSPDGRHFASASLDTTARIWRPAAVEGAPPTSVATLTGHTDQVSVVAWSPDSAALLTASRDQTTRVWDSNGTHLVTLASPHEVIAAAWSPDGQRIATAEDDGEARVWRRSGEPLATLTGHEGSLRTIAWSPDGATLLTASWDHTARLWRPDGATLTVLRGHTAAVESAAWSPDGQRIATTSSDRTARLWRPDGALLATLTGHHDSVQSAAWSPDGALLVTVSLDGTSRLWRHDGTLVAAPEAAVDALTGAVWSRDGARFVTLSETTAEMWHRDGTPLATLHNAGGRSAAWGPGDRELLIAQRNPTLYLVDSAAITRGYWQTIPRCLDLRERLRLLGETHTDAEAGRSECITMLRCLATTPDSYTACLAEFHASQAARTMHLD